MSINPKSAAFAALGAVPDFSHLPRLSKLSPSRREKFLTWLDRSGLSLYFLARLKDHRVQDRLPPAILQALEDRLILNRVHSQEWLRDFFAIGKALDGHAIPYIALKGVTLTPDYAPRFALRHQADIDLWVERSRVSDAVSALTACGFNARSVAWDDVIILAGPGDERASMKESIYRAGRARRLELHVTLVEHSGAAAIRYPEGQWRRAALRSFDGISCRTLSRADTFVYQVFHAFRHVMESWIRPSWLYEIAHFLNLNQHDDSFWGNVCDLTGDDPSLRNGLGLVLDLACKIFGAPIPAPLRHFCLAALPPRIAIWNAHFGFQFVAAGPSRNKVSLFVQKSFIANQAERQTYIRKNLFPVTRKPSLSDIRGKSLPQSFSDRWNKLHFLGSKFAYHLKALAAYPYQSLRWRLLQRFSQRA